MIRNKRQSLWAEGQPTVSVDSRLLAAAAQGSVQRFRELARRATTDPADRAGAR